MACGSGITNQGHIMSGRSRMLDLRSNGAIWVVAGIMVAGVWATDPASAQGPAPTPRTATPAPTTGGPTPAPPGSAVYFVDLKDGQTIPPNFVVHFGLTNMGIAPAGTDRPASGHHHLLIDVDLPPLNEAIPSDFNHLHFGAGQTEGEITLSPGPHTLQLLMGDKDHIPHTPPVMSPRIRVIVAGTPPPAASYERKPAPKGARVYFVGLNKGAYLTPNPVIHFGLVNMGVAPAGVEKANTGHHHLLIDTAVPPLDQPIPNDFNHLHFGAGQTEAQVTLPLGVHTLQLLLGDENHVPHDPPVMSNPIRIVVTATGEPPPRRRYKRKRY
jgi:Domain of unknown function (DUF4399)